MNAQGAAAALGENGKISTRLRRFHDAESIRLLRHAKVGGVVRGNLEKYALVGTTFVGLSCGVQKTRPKAEYGGHFFFVANRETNRLQQLLVFVGHGDVAEQSKVIAGADAIEMLFQMAGEVYSALERCGVFRVGVELLVIVGEERKFGRELSAGFVFAGKFSCFNFAGFDVGLIERVDADDSARDGSGNFTAEKFLAERVGIRQDDADDGVAGFREGIHSGGLLFVRIGLQTQIRENAIVAVQFGVRESFAVNGNNALAGFASRLRDQLLEPGA